MFLRPFILFKDILSTFDFSLSRWHYHLWLSDYIMMRHISCAVFMLQIKKRERERESCQSLLEMKVLNLSTHLLSRHSQSPAHLPWGSGKWRPNKAQSEKTLPCFHLNPFDVSASGDLDIISCPSSKRHQTRCWIQNQITEPSWAKTWCVYWLNVAYILLLVCICENYFKIVKL